MHPTAQFVDAVETIIHAMNQKGLHAKADEVVSDLSHDYRVTGRNQKQFRSLIDQSRQGAEKKTQRIYRQLKSKLGLARRFLGLLPPAASDAVKTQLAYQQLSEPEKESVRHDLQVLADSSSGKYQEKALILQGLLAQT